MPNRGPQRSPEALMREHWADHEAWRDAVLEVFGCDGYALVQIAAAKKRGANELAKKTVPTAEDVGHWNFCPHCARPLTDPPPYDRSDPAHSSFHWQDPECSCCGRPWMACPCTPAREGDCRAAVHKEG